MSASFRVPPLTPKPDAEITALETTGIDDCERYAVYDCDGYRRCPHRGTITGQAALPA